MDLGIKDKVALVTGGSRGIGFSIASELAREGAKVAIVSRDPANNAAAVEKIRAAGGAATGILADVGDKAQVKSMAERVRRELGPVGIFVYSNGGTKDLTWDNAEDEDYVHALNNLVLGFLWLVKAVQDDMIGQKWGRIVTIGSMCVKEPHRESPLILHNLGRPAAVGASKTLSSVLGPHGITVNTIATGTIDTELVRRTWRDLAPSMGMKVEDIIERKRQLTPAGRFGTPEDMSAMCAFLCSDRAGFVNGQTIFVDGGRVMSLM